MQPKFKIGDRIFGYCDIEQRTHNGIIEFVNQTCAGYPEINYEVTVICCGEKRTVFIDEADAMENDF